MNVGASYKFLVTGYRHISSVRIPEVNIYPFDLLNHFAGIKYLHYIYFSLQNLFLFNALSTINSS